MFLLDTNVISDLVRNPGGVTTSHVAEVGVEAVATSVIVAGELHYGCAKKGSARLTARVEAVLREIEILPLTPAASDHYAAIRRSLEARGHPIGQNDLWIAAQARAMGAVLVTDNAGEFARIDGLATENWLRG